MDNLENIDITIDIDKDNFRNIDIDIIIEKDYLVNIYTDKDILENIDKYVLENMDIDKGRRQILLWGFCP